MLGEQPVNRERATGLAIGPQREDEAAAEAQVCHRKACLSPALLPAGVIDTGRLAVADGLHQRPAAGPQVLTVQFGDHELQG